MVNNTQHERYFRLLDYLRDNFAADITPATIQNVSFYSYRNINRIFHALQGETIGQHIKRLKLERAAACLRYTDDPITEIAVDVGYVDLPSFSKAFKSVFACSPSNYRKKATHREYERKMTDDSSSTGNSSIPFKLTRVPALRVLYCQFTGHYDDLQGMLELWDGLLKTATKLDLLLENTIALGEVLDDDEITEDIYCRYNAAITLPDNSSVDPAGPFRIKTIAAGDYAQFLHQGSRESCADTYDLIYSQWMQHVGLEFDDRATIEFYLNDEADTPDEDLLTEICIPVVK